MISNEALAERKWGPFPELRKLFEQCPVPIEVYGWSSVSDNTAAWIARLIEIAATIDVNAKALSEEILGSVDAAALSHDMEHLRSQIRCAAREIERLNARINTLGDVLHRVYSLNEDKLRIRKAAEAQAKGDAV